jgi:hypothetical protein
MKDLELALDDSLQVELAKSWARKEHWKKEVLIIQEQMCQVIMYQQWYTLWWRHWRNQGKVSENDTLMQTVPPSMVFLPMQRSKQASAKAWLGPV